MLFYFVIALAFSEEAAGVSGLNGVFLPLVPKTKVDGRGFIPDYPDNRIPLLRFFRLVSSFQIEGEERFGLQSIFGYVKTPSETDFKVNVTSYGVGGPLSNEDQTTFSHLCELTSTIEPGKIGLELYGKLADETGTNVSVLLFNDTVEFYEVANIQDQVASVLLYCFFVGVVGWILYVIFSKDKIKETKVSKKGKDAKKVKDYSEIHRSSSPSPGERKPSPAEKRGKSPRSDSPSKK